MKSLFPLRYRRVLWGTAMAACLLSGFVVLLTRIPVRAPVAQGSNSNPAAFPAKHVAQGFPRPRADYSRVFKWRSAPRRDEAHSNPAAFPAGSTAQARLVEAYGMLPLSFEINKGQTDSQVKFLSRGSGYSLFLTGNEAVLSL